MAINPFVWFVLTLLVTASNIILSLIVYLFLSTQKKLHKNLKLLKEIALFYAIGMILALILSVGLLLSIT